MICYTTQNIFKSNADCLINPVNVVGVMGGGLALEFKKRFPEMFAFYRLQCANKELTVGNVTLWTMYKENSYPVQKRTVCLFPTKDHFKQPSTVEIIDRSLAALKRLVEKEGIKKISLPMVGCGLGGLNFTEDVKPLIEKHFGQTSELEVLVHIN